jgi:Glycosyltransferases involved in cell wall biogenesis
MIIETVLRKNTEEYKKNPLITFIVPVYNTREYLIETLDSISATKSKNVEIIIVNDGSSDESHNTILEWCSCKDIQLTYLKQENSGLSAARHSGIAIARGEYIGFCDSDDWIDVNQYLKMATRAIENFCDIAICRSVVFDNDTGQSYDFYDSWLWDDLLKNNSIRITSGIGEPKIFRLEPNANTRLIRRSFFLDNKIEFPNGLHYEDLPVHFQTLGLSDRVLLYGSTGYYYRVNRPGKITGEKSERRFDVLKSSEIAFQNLKIANQDAKGNYLLLTVRMIFWCGENTLNKDRNKFFIESIELLKKYIDYDIYTSAVKFARTDLEKVLISAFLVGADKVLLSRASKRIIPISGLVKILINYKYGQKARRIALRRARQIIYSGIKRIIKKFIGRF